MSKRWRAYWYNPSLSTEGQQVMPKTPSKPTISRSQASYDEEESQACFCFESDDDNSTDKIRIKNSKRKIARGCMSNLMICAILVGYTFIGAVIFLIVEGESGFYSISSSNRPTVPTDPKSNSVNVQPRRPVNVSLIALQSQESKAKTVENLWIITEGLNILYRENWTILAAKEITKFQDQLVARLNDEINGKTPQDSRGQESQKVDWNLAKAFLYSLTVVTTIGYGNITPRTTLGKTVTMAYAAIGIPLMLIYLSSMGTLLSNCARHFFTRSLCCCLCSNCGYCCYDEKRMQDKERKRRRKREQKEYEQQMQTIRHHQEPFFVRSPSSTFTTSTSNNLHSPARVESDGIKMAATRAPSTGADSESLSVDTSSVVEAKSLKENVNCLAPLSFCLAMMTIYVCGGAAILCRLEGSWSFLDSVFFCFMTLSTVGFGDAIPSASVLSTKAPVTRTGGSLIIWFCSLYILTGMALTAMCFNIVHDEIVHKLKHQYNECAMAAKMTKENSVSTKIGSTTNFLDSDSTANAPIDYPPTS